MGESRSVAEFSGKIIAGSVALAAANKVGVQRASAAATATILASAAPDTGGDMKLSRFRSGKGVRLSAGFRVQSVGAELAMGVVRPRPLGPWALLESGAVPHAVVPGASRSARRAGTGLDDGAAGPVATAGAVAGSRRGRRRGRVLSFGPGQVAAYAPHPGSDGKETWSKGAAAARPVAVTAYRREHRAALVGAFR